MEGRKYSRTKKSRETLVGVDSTGTEFWLVPFSESKHGHRRFEMKKCSPNKKLPAELTGMFTDTGTAFRVYEAYQSSAKAKKAATVKRDTTDTAKA